MKTWIRRGSQSALAILAGTLLISGEAFAQSLRFWTTEEQPDRLAKQEQMAADFKSKTGISVEVIPISESDLGTRATAAFAAGDLPDAGDRQTHAPLFQRHAGGNGQPDQPPWAMLPEHQIDPGQRHGEI